MTKNGQIKITNKDKEVSMPEDIKAKFPKDFLWGASVSAHQVEGGNHNQWTEWEKTHAEFLASNASTSSTMPWTAKYGSLNNWPGIRDNAQNPENYISGRGVEHYEKFKEDFDIAKSLNLNALRFGIEWSRIEPKEGEFDKKEIEHYRDYIRALISRNIEPVLNIWHWSNPVWFESKGGFKKTKNLKYFERFVELIAKEYCTNLKYVITINEANTYSATGYMVGTWPPGEKNPINFLRTYYNMSLAHKKSYKILKEQKPSLQVGVAHAVWISIPSSRYNPFSWLYAHLFDYASHYWFLNRIKRYQDFIGFNFYHVNYISSFRVNNPSKPLSDMGWYMEPGRSRELINNLYRKYKKPIFITENGVADANDQYRKWWIEEMVNSISSVINEDKIPMVGYMHWSLLDNFEWIAGWWPKFGLVAVDREHGMKRTIRPSAKWYAERISKLTVPK